MRLGSVLLLAGVGGLTGCATAPGPIFPRVSPDVVWPQPPDTPRIRYIGELRGEASLGRKPEGWDAIRGLLTGPEPQMEFMRPTAVAVAGERVFVADAGLGVVHMLDLATRDYQTLRGNPEDPLHAPLDVLVTPTGDLLVADRRRACLDVFDSAGNWRLTRRYDELRGPIALCWDAFADGCWVVDVPTHTCVLLDEQWQVVRTIGGRGGEVGQFNYPAAAAWHPALGLAVADAMNFRVQVFDAAGDVTLTFGQKGDAAGDFSRPRDIAVDSAGHIYVLDNQFENIQIFDRLGRLLMAFGEEGDGPGQFALPGGITIDDRDRIWVADSYNRRVQVFQYLAENEQ